ncbi:MAG: YgiT-type zinc finger protein [Euryarchaeota archaeon]|nr:YgiT-type zinc finger protein [Euryarchaeota archaeon]
MNTKKENPPPMADIPTITPEMEEGTKIEIAKRRAGRHGSPLKNVTYAACPVCGSQTVSFADDLVFEVVLAGERIVIPNLTGLRCSNCGDFAFDAGSSKIIDRYTKNKPACGYECSISTVGAGKLGMYLPKGCSQGHGDHEKRQSDHDATFEMEDDRGTVSGVISSENSRIASAKTVPPSSKCW